MLQTQYTTIKLPANGRNKEIKDQPLNHSIPDISRTVTDFSTLIKQNVFKIKIPFFDIRKWAGPSN